MKKFYLTGALFAIAFIVLAATQNLDKPNAINPGEEIPVSAFSSVGIAIPAIVNIEQGNQHSLKIEASKEVLDEIEVEVKDQKLRLKCKEPGCRIKGEVKVFIVTPELNELSVAGSAEVNSGSSFKAGDLSLKIAGSGKIRFANLSAEAVNAEISGSGDVQLSGSGSSEMSVAIAGSGNVNSEGFKVGEMTAKISGSGDCRVWVEGELDASIAGSGSVLYKGNAQVNTKIAGSGKVNKL